MTKGGEIKITVRVSPEMLEAYGGSGQQLSDRIKKLVNDFLRHLQASADDDGDDDVDESDEDVDYDDLDDEDADENDASGDADVHGS
jgi:hypothetical protein